MVRLIHIVVSLLYFIPDRETRSAHAVYAGEYLTDSGHVGRQQNLFTIEIHWAEPRLNHTSVERFHRSKVFDEQVNERPPRP